jgi:hypothetical protein
MPILQYFGWVGGFLLAALLAASWRISAPIALARRSDVPLDQMINIRIHTDQKWPERVVFDTTHLGLAPEARVDSETDNRRSETIAQAERQPFDAFAEMAAIPARPCFRPPCSSGQAADREASPAENGARSQNRPRVGARKLFTFPNRLHKPPGRS